MEWHNEVAASPNERIPSSELHEWDAGAATRTMNGQIEVKVHYVAEAENAYREREGHVSQAQLPQQQTKNQRPKCAARVPWRVVHVSEFRHAKTIHVLPPRPPVEGAARVVVGGFATAVCVCVWGV